MLALRFLEGNTHNTYTNLVSKYKSHNSYLIKSKMYERNEPESEFTRFDQAECITLFN